MRAAEELCLNSSTGESVTQRWKKRFASSDQEGSSSKIQDILGSSKSFAGTVYPLISHVASKHPNHLKGLGHFVQRPFRRFAIFGIRSAEFSIRAAI